jgi:hypothetical protein
MACRSRSRSATVPQQQQQQQQLVRQTMFIVVATPLTSQTSTLKLLPHLLQTTGSFASSLSLRMTPAQADQYAVQRSCHTLSRSHRISAGNNIALSPTP